MELTDKRKWYKPTYTIGKLLIDGREFCDTLEDKDRGLVQTMPTAEIYKRKVYGQTAIPKGRYRIDMSTVSPRCATRSWARPYGGIVPRIAGVPGFDGVLIHPGNSPEETLGCLLVGENKAVGKVLNSVATYRRLMDEYLVPAVKRGEDIWIRIE